MKTVAYCRVSTVGQKDNSSLANQRKAIEQYCKAYSIELDQVFEEQISGAKKDRPELENLMDFVRTDQVERVIVYKLDRLGRNMSHLVSLTEEFDERQIQFVSIKEAIDTSTPTGRLFKNIMASLADFERELIRDRVMSGRIAKAESGKGWIGGKPPFGYSLSDGELYIMVETQNIVKSIYGLYTKKRLSMSKIADHLNDHNIPTSSGSKWTSRGVLNILKNPIYKGKAKWGEYETTSPAIVSARAWNFAQKLRADRRTTKG